MAELKKSCPESSEWAALAAGAVAASEATRLLEHAAQCQECGRTLREFAEDFDDESRAGENQLIATLASSDARWQESMAQRMAAQNTAAHREWAPAWSWATAASVLLVAALGWLAWRRYTAPPFHLLARAYSSTRSFELRVPGATHAPLRVTRGAAGISQSAEFLDSKARIVRALARHPDDAGWLHARGVSELLEWRYEDAIRTLRLARDTEGDSPDLLTNLATAYFQRAEAMNRPIDYSMAADLLGGALRLDSGYRAALFNRAIAYERMQHLNEALGDWQRYLELDPGGGWADEARQRRDELRRKLDQKKQAQGGTNREPEDLLPEAVTSWLPAAFPERGERDVAALGRINELAVALRDRNRDPWLADLAARPHLSGAVRFLAEAARANRASDIQTALARAHAARALFESLRNPAGSIRAALEAAFAVNRPVRPDACAAQIEEPLRAASGYGYAWLHSQLALEMADCHAARNELEQARRQASVAGQVALEHGYSTLRLRAMAFQTSFQRMLGYYREACMTANEGLQLYWASGAPPVRAQHFYQEVGNVSESLGRLDAAMASLNESATAASQQGLTTAEALARSRWADLALRSGRTKSAEHGYSRVRALFATLPDNDLTRADRLYAEAGLHEAARSREGLERFASVAAEVQNPAILTRYERVLALQLEAAGRYHEAETQLRSAVGRFSVPARSMPRAEDRRGRNREMRSTYEALILNRLRAGAAEEALGLWQDFLRGSPTDSSAPARSRLALLTAEKGVLLVFARLSERYGIWTVANGSAAFQWANIDAREADRLARRFAALSADESGPAQPRHEAGRRLAASLLGSVETALETQQELLLETDGELAGVPWQALPHPAGGYWIERHPILHIAPLAASETRERRLELRAGHALIVAATTVHPELAAAFAPLPGVSDEAMAVRTNFDSADVLEGADASPATLESRLADADVLHFAGHAQARVDGVQLVLAPSRSAGSAEMGLWNPQSLKPGALRRCRLAVFSACSTARFEEQESASAGNLARAFLSAGVPHVIASLWDVDSVAASAFMRTFYTALSGGKTLAAAARDAALALLERAATAHPRFWAPFQAFSAI